MIQNYFSRWKFWCTKLAHLPSTSLAFSIRHLVSAKLCYLAFVIHLPKMFQFYFSISHFASSQPNQIKWIWQTTKYSQEDTMCLSADRLYFVFINMLLTFHTYQPPTFLKISAKTLNIHKKNSLLTLNVISLCFDSIHSSLFQKS